MDRNELENAAKQAAKEAAATTANDELQVVITGGKVSAKDVGASLAKSFLLNLVTKLFSKGGK